jgi:hypothetical protein
MKLGFVLGAAVLVASCVFAQDVFAQRSGPRGFGEGGYRAVAPGNVGRPRIRVVIRPGLWWAGQPRLIYYPYLISRTCQLELPHSILQVMMEERAAELGRVPVAELLRRISPRVLVEGPGYPAQADSIGESMAASDRTARGGARLDLAEHLLIALCEFDEATAWVRRDRGDRAAGLRCTPNRRRASHSAATSAQWASRLIRALNGLSPLET